jgi:hypothetical protein
LLFRSGAFMRRCALDMAWWVNRAGRAWFPAPATVKGRKR